MLRRVDTEGLENSIAADLDDEDALRVWSDAMLEAGDPAGLLVAKWMAAEDALDAPRREELKVAAIALQNALVDERIRSLVEPWEKRTVDYDVHFRHGLIRRIVLRGLAPHRGYNERRGDPSDASDPSDTSDPRDPSDPREPSEPSDTSDPNDASADRLSSTTRSAKILDALLSAPNGAFVRELVLPDVFFPPCASVIAKHAPPSLVQIVVSRGPSRPAILFSEEEERDVPLRFDGFDRLKRLRSLMIESAPADFRESSFPSLREIFVNGETPTTLNTLTAKSFPNLSLLTVHQETRPTLGASERSFFVPQSRAVTIAEELARITTLQSIRFDDGFAFLAIECARRIPSLRSLSVPATLRWQVASMVRAGVEVT